MASPCPNCGNVNDPLSSSKYCEICHYDLRAAQPGERVAGNAPPAPSGEPALSEPAAAGPSARARYPRYKTPAPTFVTPVAPAGQPVERPPAPGPTGWGQAPIFVPPEALAGAPPPPAALPLRRTGAGEVEGVVQRVDALPDEPPDPDVARILMSLLIAADLVILMGASFLGIVVGILVIIVIATLLRAQWLITLFGFVFQTVLYFLSPIFQAIIGGRGQQRNVPVVNYLLRANNGAWVTVRVKGRLRGSSIGLGDPIRARGRWRNDVLRLREGHNGRTNERLLPERSNSWIWLLLVAVANVVGFLLLTGRVQL